MYDGVGILLEAAPSFIGFRSDLLKSPLCASKSSLQLEGRWTGLTCKVF